MKHAMHSVLALVLLAPPPSFGSALAPTFEQRREQTAESAIHGCRRSIEDQVVDGYMKRRAEAGNPAASEAEARSEVTSTEWWREQMSPALRDGCICLFEAPLAEMRHARTEEELTLAAARMAAVVGASPSIQELEGKLAACFANLVGN